MFAMIRRARMTVGRKIYALICLSFVGLLGVAFFESSELASSLDQVKQSGSGFAPDEWPEPGFDKPQAILSYVVGFAPWNWVIGTGVYIDDLKAQTWASTRRSLIVAGVILLCMLAVAIFVARSVTGP